MPVTIDGTTGIQIPDGTAANPAIRGTTSANTGLFFPAANQIGFSTNSTQKLVTDANGNVGIGTTPTYKLDVAGTANASRYYVNGVPVLATNTATAVASTSGTSIDFTGIPAGTKRITIMLQNVSTNGTSLPQIQIGSGSVTTSGYTSTTTAAGTGVATSTATSGFVLVSTGNWAATGFLFGNITLTLQTGNTWIATGVVGGFQGTVNASFITNGYLSLGGALDRVRVTTVNGTDAFDLGTINIFYEY